MSIYRGAEYEVKIVQNDSGKFSAECAYTIYGLGAISDHHSQDVCDIHGALEYFDSEEEARINAEASVQSIIDKLIDGRD